MVAIFSIAFYLNYIGLLVYCMILIILAILFFRKYVQYKRLELFYFGLTFLLYTFAIYLPFILSFFMVILFGTSLNLTIHMITISFSPIVSLAWLLGITKLIFPTKRRLILILAIIYTLIIEIIHYTLFFLYGPDFLGSKVEDTVSVANHPFIIFYIFVSLLILLITALFFIAQALKKNKEEVRLKAKILLGGVIFYLVGTIFESVIPLYGALSIITRIFQILGAIFIYSGFTLPEWMKKVLMK